jgi:hypothetical protein
MNALMRCPTCKGQKKLAKLGGVVGDCDTCEASGKIKVKDKPVPFVVNRDDILSPAFPEIVKEVSSVEPELLPAIPSLSAVQALKAQGKKVAFKHKSKQS